jgi:hypothetical protein
MSLIIMLFVSLASAAPPTEVGEHQKLFVIKKSENPQNIMVVYTKVDVQCRFVLHDSVPVLDIYWLMNGEKYKAVHPMLRSEIQKRLNYSFEKFKPHSFNLRIAGTKELTPDFPEVPITITANRSGSGHGCDVEAFIKFDSTNEKTHLEVVQAISERKLWPPFRKLKSVTFESVGVDGKTARHAYSVKD